MVDPMRISQPAMLTNKKGIDMESLKLKVTPGVIRENQKQIAILYPQTSLFASSLRAANKDNRIDINIAGAWTLAFGDTHATWRSHNPGKEKEFDALFEFLSKFPDQEFGSLVAGISRFRFHA